MTLDELRPLTMGEILDGAFTLYRRHFRTMAGTALLAHAPLVLMWAWFVVLNGVDAYDDSIVLLARALQVIATVVCAGALTQQANAAYRGGTVSLAEGLALLRRRFWPICGALLLRAVMVSVGLLLLVAPGIAFTLMLFAILPAAVVEERSPSEAATRSSDLARGAWGRVAGVVVVATLLVWVSAIAVDFVVGVGADLLGAGSFAVDAASQAGLAVGYALGLPVQSIAILLLYYDRRVRAEGLDLQDAAAALA